MLTDEIVSAEPALVVLCGYSPARHAMLAWGLSRKDVRIGLRSDNTIPHSNFRGIKGVVKKVFLPFLLNLYDTWHPVGTLAKQYLEKVGGRKKPTFYFPYNVDNDWFARESARHRRNFPGIRAELGLSKDDFVVLGIMKWHEREDPLTLVRAFVEFKYQCRDARLIVVGDGPLRSVVHSETKRLGSDVILPGYTPYSELPKYYAVSDVFVHPAVHESWGVSVNEAMACGVPVIAAEGVGAGMDLIAEWRTGTVYPNRDVDALSDKLFRLASEPGLLKQMGREGGKKISEWSYEHTCRQFLMAMES